MGYRWRLVSLVDFEKCVDVYKSNSKAQVLNKIMAKTNGIKKDWLYAAGGIGGFFAVLKSSGWIDQNFDFSAIYNVVDYAAVAAKVLFTSALVWSIKRFVFPSTLGKDFGSLFNAGWESMTTVEKTRWMLGVFVSLFVAIMFVWNSK